MNEKIEFPNSPVADTARQILEKCSELGYPPEAWSLPNNVGSRRDPGGTFSSVWKGITGQDASASANALPFSWNPDELHARSSEFLAIHKTILLKELEPREGTACEIDLFGWFWKSVVEDYINSIADLKMPEEVSGINLSYVPPDGSWVPSELIEEERKREAAMLENLDEETKNAWGDLIGPDSGKAERQLRCRRNFYDDIAKESRDTLGFTTAFCLRHHCRQGESLSETTINEIQSNEAIKLRFLLWWGWPGSPFMSMQRMIREQTEHMVDEGYLRLKAKATSHSPAKYALTDAGLKRLTELDPAGKIGLLDYIKLNDLVGLGANLSSLCQFLFPR